MPDNNATNAGVAINQAAHLIRQSYPAAAELTFRFGGNPKVLSLSTIYNAAEHDIWCTEDVHSDQLRGQEDIVDWLRRAMDYTHPELPPYVTRAQGYGDDVYRLDIQKALLAEASPYVTATLVLVGVRHDWHPEQLPDLGSEDLAALITGGGVVAVFGSFEAGISAEAQRMGAEPSDWPDRAELRQMLQLRQGPAPHGWLYAERPSTPVNELLDRLRAAAAKGELGSDMLDLLRALQIRAYPPAPDTDDRSEQIVVELLGVEVSVRRRPDGTFVHIDTDDLADEHRPLLAEVNNGGENTYGEPRDTDD